MKLLYINTFYAPYVFGGTEFVLENIAKGMSSRGNQVTVLSLSQNDNWNFDKVDGIDCIRMPVANLYLPYPSRIPRKWERYAWKLIDCYNPIAEKYVASQLSNLRPDVVVTNNLSGISIAAWQACRQMKIPTIHVLHDYYLLCPNINMIKDGHPCKENCGRCKLLRWPHRHISSKVTAVVGVSRSILDTHRRLGFFDKVEECHVIYNASDIKAAAPDNRREGPFVFGYIGGLTPVKGIERLIRAFGIVAANANATLLIAGSGEKAYVDSLKALPNPGTVKFLGYVEPGAFYSSIDALVVPSLWQEPLGVVVYEGLARGVPVIGSRRGGIPEMITHGVNGLLYEPSDDRNLVAAMLRLMSDGILYSKLRNKAAASVSHFTNVERLIDEHEAVALRISRRAK